DKSEFENSLLAKYLRDAVMPEYDAVGADEGGRKAADIDAAEKVKLLGEIAGARRLDGERGSETRIRNIMGAESRFRHAWVPESRTKSLGHWVQSRLSLWRSMFNSGADAR